MEGVGEAPATVETRRCPNCAEPAPGRFCAACGQVQRELRVPFLRVLGETLEETLSVDSRLARTLPALFLRPGDATRAWREGRRASFTSPTKLYLVASFLFFLALAVGPDFRVGLGPSRATLDAEVDPAAHPVQAEPSDLAELRALGSLGTAFADHLERLQRLPAEEAARRVSAGLVDNAAKAMFVLVPFMALVLLALHLGRRRGRIYYTEHLTFALHAQTVTFVFLLPGTIAGSGLASLAGALGAGLHLLVAMHRVYGASWAVTLLRWLALSFVYLLAVTATVAGAALAAVMTS